MKYFEILKMFVSLLPVITALVDTVEQLFPAGGKGQVKLEMVKTMLQHAHDFGSNATVTFDQFWPVAQSLIAAIVAAKK